MALKPNDSPASAAETPIFGRRAARDAFCRNAFLWGVGNSFVNSTFVVYFLKEAAKGASGPIALGTAISWVVAAPRFVGFLRLATPFAIDFVGSRKRFCVLCAFFSPLILLALPFGEKFLTRLATTNVDAAFWLVGAVWALYHLVEYFATAALWSWIGDALTPTVRARFFARRERRLIAGKLVGLAGLALYSAATLPGAFASRFGGGAFAAFADWSIFLPLVGIVFLSASALPLIGAPEFAWRRNVDGVKHKSNVQNGLRRVFAPLKSRPFLALVLFGATLQLAMGLSQAPQYYFRTNVLEFSLFASQALTATISVGQWSAARRAAGAVAKFGAVRASGAALVCVAFGFVLYAVATAESGALLFVAAGCWIAWIVVNLAINVELTKRSDEGERSAFVAFYFTATTLTFGLATTLGGFLFDRFGKIVVEIPRIGVELNYLQITFVGAAILLGVAPIALLFGRKNSPKDENKTERQTENTSERVAK